MSETSTPRAQDKALETIRRLLRLGTSSNEHEAQLALAKAADGSRWLAIAPMIYTHAIITSGTDPSGYDDRWCYATYAAARAALAAWDGRAGTEPMGWHRHPGTGRRRPDGDPAKQYVNP